MVELPRSAAVAAEIKFAAAQAALTFLFQPGEIPRPAISERDLRIGRELVANGGSLTAAAVTFGVLPIEVLDSIMRLLA